MLPLYFEMKKRQCCCLRCTYYTLKNNNKYIYIYIYVSSRTHQCLLFNLVANDPAYKLDKMSVINLEIYNPLAHIFNVKNTIRLMKGFLGNPFGKDLKFVFFDIKNMYSNVPVKEVIKIIELMCNQNDINK